MALSLLVELKRRRVFRAMVGYGIAAFAVLQIVEPVMHGLHWPDAVLSYVVVALAAGFPIVVTLAWIFDVQGGRLERTEGGRPGIRRLLLLAGIGVLAAAPGLIWYFGFRGRSQTPPASPSIVVLPFANLSGDKENDYFSDGMTEEIINALANVEGVHVVARTSAFSFKGKNLDVRKIGAELNVATVLEGSVRREGNQLRVFAQLIGVADGYHLWSKSYDRELKGVFSVEDELARAIVLALKPKLMRDRALAAQRLLAEAERHVADNRFPRGALAAARLAVGDKDGAFAWLEKAAEEQDPLLALTVKSNPTWDPVRSDPRFQKVLRRMNLE